MPRPPALLRHVAIAAVLGMLLACAASPAPAAAGPRLHLVAAKTNDADGDGRIDSITVRWSAPVRIRGAAASFRVAGYRVLGVAARGSTVTVRVAEQAFADTGATPVIGYAPAGRARVEAASRVRGAARASLAAADAAAPVLVSARADGGWPESGTVVATWSEPVTYVTGTVAPFLLARGGDGALPIAGVFDGPAGVETSLTPLLYGSVPNTVAYRQTPTSGAVRDAARNLARTTPRPVRVAPAPPGTPAPPATPPAGTPAPPPAGSTSPPAQDPPAPPADPTTTPPPPDPTTTTPPPPDPTTTPPPSSGGSGGSGPPTPQIVGSVLTPIGPANTVKWGQRSHWVQPWRTYLDTWPASRMRDAIGINFNVRSSEAQSTARLLAANGFKRARIEIGFGDLGYPDPTTIRNVGQWQTRLRALRDNGIRPLILLNSNHNWPCPTNFFNAVLTAPAAAGARTLQVDSATAQAAVPGRTGLNQIGGAKAADILFTSVDTSTNTVTLSKPLPVALNAGSYKAATLMFEPFHQPFRADGTPDPEFERTMQGWLDYVGVVTTMVKQTLGDDNFDVEVWNELSFGSDFIDIRRYYNPAPPSGMGSQTAEILKRTVAYLRSPAHGVSNVRIGDGFANQAPWAAGPIEPVGLSAIDKHPYKGRMVFPRDAVFDPGTVPLDANDNAAYHPQGTWPPLRVDDFVPSYVAFFPEYFLNSIQTENVVRDVSPIAQNIGSVAHGRYTTPPGGSPLSMWITEYNMDISGGADPSNPANLVSSAGQISGAQARHVQAKMALRSLSSYVGKGVSNIDFYAATGGSLGFIDPRFMGALGPTGANYPGDGAGGETIDAIGRFSRPFNSGSTISAPRSLTLDRIDDFTGNTQFAGNGTSQFPPLYNRDVLGFFPFQTGDSHFVVPVFVMTRDLVRVYQPGLPATDPARFDMPPETYRLTIGGVHGDVATVSAKDPLTGADVPVDVVSRSSNGIVVELPVTDSPRLLDIDDS